MVIFCPYKIWSLSKFCINFERGKNYQKNLWNHCLLDQIQAGPGANILKTEPGAGAKLFLRPKLEIKIIHAPSINFILENVCNAYKRIYKLVLPKLKQTEHHYMSIEQ